MEITDLLTFTHRQQLRAWLSQHHLTDASCWVACSRSLSALPGTLPHATALVLLIACLALGSCATHPYVDLGLPSGTLWATCNLGADRPEEFGDFYAWGETKPKDAYTPENYTFLTARTTLSVRADAARRRWHGRWRTPSVSQWAELRDACIWTWLPEWAGHGTVKGYRIIGPNGNAIFLPAAGDIDDTTHYGIDTYGDYWSSSLRPDDPRQAQGFIFYSDGAFMLYNWSRHSGHSIRPVRRR